MLDSILKNTIEILVIFQDINTLPKIQFLTSGWEIFLGGRPGTTQSGKKYTSASVTYTSVVSKYSVCIILTAYTLNGPAILGAEIYKAYFMVPNKQKVYLCTENQFGALGGNGLILVQALCGLISSGASFWEYLEKNLENCDFSHQWLTLMSG